jgi:hypothetical protein
LQASLDGIILAVVITVVVGRVIRGRTVGGRDGLSVCFVVGHVNDAVAEQIIAAVIESAARLFWLPTLRRPHHECFKIEPSK